ncbi:MAG: NUDIX hydrolase [Geobacteraceae bacterium]|nr:NUDIX hydrolase [Geobacteraceae bacterium]
MADTSDQKPWKLLRSEPGPELPVFKVRYDWLENPRNNSVLKAVVLDFPEWVSIAAITPDKRIVTVRQYRFGGAHFTTELPSGLAHPGEPHRAAAERELLEETGYTSSDWVYLGWVEPNPAFQNNRLHQWLARDARQTHATQLDAGEDIRVETLLPDEIHQYIRDGRLRHSLALLSLARIMPLWNTAGSKDEFFQEPLILDQGDAAS